MTRRKALLKQIAREAKKQGLEFGLLRSGGSHDIYSLDGLHIAVKRHKEIEDEVADTIRQEFGEKLGRNWWK